MELTIIMMEVFRGKGGHGGQKGDSELGEAGEGRKQNTHLT